VIGFIEHLQIVTTSNYSAIANSHSLQFTTTRTNSSQFAVSSLVDVPLLPDSRPRRLFIMLLFWLFLMVIMLYISIARAKLDCHSVLWYSLTNTDSNPDKLWYIVTVSAYVLDNCALSRNKYACICCTLTENGPPLWSSGQSSWLQIQRSRVRFPALPDFLRSSGSGTRVHSAS
jgi:hypothetical protein